MNFNFEYDKLFLKKITILIPKYHNNLTSFLTPILGLYGINIKEFINEFQNKTRFLNLDVLVPVRVSISKIKSFSLTVDTPFISNIISNIQAPSYKDLNILSLYKVFLIKSIFINKFETGNLHSYKSFRKYLSLVFLKNASPLYFKKSGISLNFDRIICNSLTIRKNLLFSYSYGRLVTNQYGYFFFFSNFDSSLVEFLKKISSTYHLDFFKFKPHSLVANLPTRFLKDGFYWGSKNFNHFSSFFQKTRFNVIPSFFPLFVRFKSNLLTYNFYKNSFTKEFYNLSDTFKLVKILFSRLIILSQLLKIKNLLIIKVLNANLPPVTP